MFSRQGDGNKQQNNINNYKKGMLPLSFNSANEGHGRTPTTRVQYIR